MRLKRINNLFWEYFKAYRFPILIFVFAKFLTILIIHVSYLFYNHFKYGTLSLMEIWYKWDSSWFISVYQEGYFLETSRSNAAFFPFLPFLTGFLTYWIKDYKLAGLIIINLSFLIGLILLFQVVKSDFDEKIAEKTVIYTTIFPSAFIFSMYYSESVFFCLCIASFYFAKRNKWFFSSLMGFFASMTRFPGIALFPAILILYLEKRNFKLREAKVGTILQFLLIPLGLLMVMSYHYLVTNDLFAFLHAERFWGRYIVFPWTTISNSLELVIKFIRSVKVTPVSILTCSPLVDLSFTLIFIPLTFYIFKFLKLSYSIFAVLVFYLPLFSGHLQSVPRYLLSSFPFFILLSLFGKSNKLFEVAYLIISALLFAVFLAFFSLEMMCF